MNADLSWALPVGRGKRFGGNMSRALDALLGGWMITGVYRQTSGLPMTISDGSRWATNWQLSVGATPNGNPLNLFSNPAAAVAAFSETMAGQSGVRNTIRGGASSISIPVS